MLDYELRGGKSGEEEAHTPVETPNNLLSVAYAKVLIAVAEGELAGVPTDQDIFLDGTPLVNSDGSQNFGGVTWEWRSGTSDQTYISGLPEVATEYTVGVELKSGIPYVRNVTKTALDALRITFQWPALMEQKDNGDTDGISIDYRIEIQTDAGPFVEYQTYNIDGKTNTSYERTHRIDLPKATSGWNVRAVKITADSEEGTVQDTMNVKSISEVVDVKQRYPNTAMLFVKFDSSMFGGGSIPKISVRTKGRIIRVPTNYDPITRDYSGVWSGDFKWAWSDNPAWVYHDIVTQDRFGLGHKVTLDMVDKWSLYEIAQYCDVLVDDGMGAGVKEPRHTCNIYIQEKQEAWQVLRDIASIFNGMTYWNGNQFTAVADKQEAFNNAPIFSRSNVANGRFDYDAADDKSIYTSALVSYDDAENHYNTSVESTFETSQILRWGGDRQVEISAIGCTSRGEAQRRGKYTLITNMYNRSVSFRTGLQGLGEDVMPGKLIHVVDPLIGGRQFTGRLKAATGAVLTLDRDIDGVAGDIMYVTRTNGVTEGRTIESVSGNIVTVQVGYTEQPVSNSVWYLEAADLKSQLFRVTKVTEPEPSVFEIEAVEYNDSKYAAVDTGARLEARPISVVPPNIQAAPTNVTITSYTYVEQTMAISTMVMSWDQMPNAVGYEVQWKVGSGDWVNLGVTGSNEISVKGIYTGQYVGRVRAINASGIKSIWATSAITSLQGKAGTPPAVTSIVATGLIFGIRLDWYFPQGAEDTLVTEFRYSETSSFDASIPLGDFAYPISSHEMHGISAGKKFWFWCRLHDRSGNIGPWFPASSASGVMGQSLINDNGQYNDYFAGLISGTALDKQLYDRIELIDGPADLPGSVNDRIETVNDSIDTVNDKLDQAIIDLETLITDYTDALLYDPLKSGYVKDEIVRVDNKLYQALKAVPQGVAPPNTEYWKDVGTILEELNGVITQVDANTQDIGIIDGKLTATATQLEGISAQFRDDSGEGDLQDSLAGWGSRAQIVEERSVRATADDAMSQRVILITAEVGTNKAAISTLEQTTASSDTALSQRIDSVSATTNTELGKVNAAITSEQTARATADTALGSRVDVVSAKINTETSRLDAAVITEQTARVNADGAIGQRITTVQATQVLENQRLDAAVSSEATSRTTADTALGTRIDTVGATITTEIGKVTAAVQTEATARTTADTALGTRVDVVQANITSEGVSRRADIQTETTARVTADSALGVRVDTVSATITTEVGKVNAAILSEQNARVTAVSAVSTRVDQVSASVTTEETARKAAITSEQTARIAADASIASRVDTIEAGGIDLTQINALIQVESTARANADNALSLRITTVQAKADGNSASIQTVSSAQAATDGKVNTAWTLKMEVNSLGQYVAAGIGLGIENGPSGLQSQFLVRADRFAVVSGENGTTHAPFVVQNGQTFINQAIIGTAWITNAMIGDQIYSNNYEAGKYGWLLRKDGVFEINGNIPGQGRVIINSNGVNVFDGNGVLRVQLGNLG